MTIARLLLVEDSREDVLFFRRALDRVGLKCRIEVARDGRFAVDYLAAAGEQDRPTHVLLDLKMPRMSGLEVLAWIRASADYRRTPVMILTSSQIASDMDEAGALGIDAFHIKPVDFQGLIQIVRSIAERWAIPVETAGMAKA